MQELDKKYADQIEELAEEIQKSEELSIYLDTEEDEDFNRLKEMFEPKISLLYDQVANEVPLQLISLEKHLLDVRLEGLFLPKILGYSVLRGEFNDRIKYVRPQSHFQDILLAICNSANFDILKKRIGQTIQVGFALSSDIWITNLIGAIDNKRVRYFLQGQKLEKYRVPKERQILRFRYSRQFLNDNYQTAIFPDTLGQLKSLYSPLKNFLLYRAANKDLDNASIMPSLREFAVNEAFFNTKEHQHIIAIYGFFFPDEEVYSSKLAEMLAKERAEMPDFNEEWFNFINDLHKSDVNLTPEADLRMVELLDLDVENDDISEFYALVEWIHSKGYTQEDTQDAVRSFHRRYEGLSTLNECLRETVLQYFKKFVNNLGVTQYAEYFEITKLMIIYMDIFANQYFNQELKQMSMKYIKRCLKRYTDKRGKDYQDIKKFVSTAFLDMGFLKEKEIVELFKTRRKKKPTVS